MTVNVTGIGEDTASGGSFPGQLSIPPVPSPLSDQSSRFPAAGSSQILVSAAPESADTRPSTCPHRNAYCAEATRPGNQHVCTGATYTVASPARHVSSGNADLHMVQALIQDFWCTPDADGVSNPQVSLQTAGDALDLHNPTDVFALADGFEKFAEQLRDLGRQLRDLRAAANVQGAEVGK